MPLSPGRVTKDGDVRKSIVMINDVSDVGHALAALVGRHVKGRRSVVGHVDLEIPVGVMFLWLICTSAGLMGD